MYGTTLGVVIISLAAVAQTVAVFIGAAALGIGSFLYATHRTAVLRIYLVFLASIFLFVLSFWFREIGTAVTALVSVSPVPDGSGSRFVRALVGASFIAEAVAGIVLVVILPRMTHGLFYRSVPVYRHAIAITTALVMAGLALTIVAAPVRWAPIVLISLMFGSVAISIVELAVRTGRQRAHLSSPKRTGRYPGQGTAAAIRAFLLVSAVFLPLFVGDIVISSSGEGWAGHPIISALDNLSIPLYFIVLASGSVFFAYHFLNEPPLMADEQVSEFGQVRYGLTEREAEVIEYIAEGFTVADAATAMKISPKTVENHLYSVYQKTGVTNRIQLYNLFQNRRRM
ncbi:MAG: response regulator transcription factor [Spirochaetota bacterium]